MTTTPPDSSSPDSSSPARGAPVLSTAAAPVPLDGASFCIRDWRGSGPATLHVHHADDEAWHVLAGTLRFRLTDRSFEAQAGTTVLVPAGVAHTYEALPEARYLLVMTPRLRDLIAALHGTRDSTAQADVYRRFQSELLETGRSDVSS